MVCVVAEPFVESVGAIYDAIAFFRPMNAGSPFAGKLVVVATSKFRRGTNVAFVFTRRTIFRSVADLIILEAATIRTRL